MLDSIWRLGMGNSRFLDEPFLTSIEHALSSDHRGGTWSTLISLPCGTAPLAGLRRDQDSGRTVRDGACRMGERWIELSGGPSASGADAGPEHL
ncbi:hypothetical protein M8818_004670 [Zalaria obscura]|uniref:Uncharacterized protein n=1 Tax=Zalaria obscura TaxID=2024903 RepID=A0ACC3SBT1_9PEZI